MNSALTLSVLSMPTAWVGPVNPLPPLFRAGDPHVVADLGDADEELSRNAGYGRVSSVMPYLMQDSYGRERTTAEHRVAVLENDVLRATFLLDAGGRLWSLIHKPSGRELLFSNPVFQPANLALRNAWFAGGVEWNIGTIGHTPTTCEPLHAVRAVRPDGTPVLRMYEYERLRRVVFQIDAYLPESSPVLLVHVTIVNPNDHEVPMYWWSNIAVPQGENVRVVAPADEAYRFTYDKTIRRVAVPESDGLERTYPSRAVNSSDLFFDIPAGSRHWIAALDGAGAGLVQTSTKRLAGRKLFVWGKHTGGERWQEWLSEPGQGYLEIQAGLARTQLEHLPMPAHAQWRWVEAYGLAQADPVAVHGDWAQARAAVESGLDELVDATGLDKELLAAESWVDSAPVEHLHSGTGWGALEHRLRVAAGDHSFERAATPFPEHTLGPEQLPWISLLDTGELPAGDVSTPPPSYQVAPEWGPLLEDAQGWLPCLLRGVLQCSSGDVEAAEKSWFASITEMPNAWAWRNLGALFVHRGEHETAVEAYAKAHRLAPGLLALSLEYVGLLLELNRQAHALAVIAGLPAEHRQDGRVRLFEARCAVDTGDLARAGRLIDEGIVVPAIRESNVALSDLWLGYQAKRGGPIAELPRDYDFRMHPRGE
ncbi:hypothetical protein UK23_08460 [Lentzea aerocolonigenes]|uniref:DUF5107 domain-containing protein n=1 Tax=Lentzea aerocolonigenes TaxID=68170 RepID=A0A0F0H5M2_LENAE|nr:DUF5107 domain-containing protein [Lentzea aerocolonigenes]KJK51009.1 hypothetical protein UK23_08460 [Lentzea aerocolonigenes]